MPHRVTRTALDQRAWYFLLLAVLGVLLWLLHAELLFTPAVPAGYDLTGHIVPIAELRSRLLPSLRVHGWSYSWFAGFPLFYFYFPAPAMGAAALSLLLPLTVALKLITVAGVLLLPCALYALVRALACTRAEAAVAASIASSFLLMQSFWFLGGNIASTLAGEFAMSISLALSIFYLAALLRARAALSAGFIPGVLLALVALSHLVTTFTIVVVTAFLLIAPLRRRAVITSWLIGFALSAFWTVPFLLRHGEMSEVYRTADRSLREVLPLELWPVLLAALAAALSIRRERALITLAGLALAGIAGYLLADRLVYPGRFLPYWYLGLHLLAGYGFARALFARRRVLALIIVAPLLMLNLARGTGYLRTWSQATLAGLETRPTWPALQQLHAQLAGAEGRIYWEQAPDRLALLGSRNLAAATPLFVNGAQVLNGLWLESAALHHELAAIDSAVAAVALQQVSNPDSALDAVLGRLRALGATRFVALNSSTAEVLTRARGVRLLHTSNVHALFAIPGAPLVSGGARITEWSHERVRYQPGGQTVDTIRMAHFPNWRLSDGSRPMRAGNGMMLVPGGRNEVTLEFAPTWVEVFGALLTLSALVWLVVWLGWFRVLPGNREARDER